MQITRIKHKFENFKSKVIQFTELTKLALELIKKIDNKLIKIDFMSSFLNQTSTGLGVILLGVFLNSIQEGDTSKSYLILLVIFLNLVVINLITSYLEYRYDYLYTFRNVEIFKTITERIKKIPVRYRNSAEFIEIESNADIQKIFQFFRNYINIITSFYGVAITFLALSFIEPFLILFLILIGVVSFYFQAEANSKEFSKRNESSYYNIQDYFMKENFKIKELANLNDNLKINNNSKFLLNYYVNVYLKKYKEWFNELHKDTEGKKLWSSNLLNLGSSLALMYVYNNGITGVVQLGNLVIFAQAYQRLADSISSLTRSMAILFQSYLNVKAVSDLINFQIPVSEYKKIPSPTKLEIEFINVSFTYPGTSNEVLKNVSFKINNKDHLGIIGENGAGKSTIINLLFKIYLPTTGTILLNGTDIHDIDDDEYFQKFSILPQKTNQEVGLSIEDIIFLGDTSKPKNIKRIIDSAKKASLHDQIVKLEAKYKQLVTSQSLVSVWNKYSETKFTSFSGGQFRKLLLAKMFYSQKPIYVFDEPTDSIDPESAFKIFKNIKEIPHAQIIIFITHDVQRLQLASNKVLVLKDGEVIEFGETESLIKNKKSELNKALATYHQTIK